MMKHALPSLPLLSLLTTTAHAHQAIHQGTIPQVLLHFLSEPDHLAMMGLAGILGWLLVRHIRSRSS